MKNSNHLHYIWILMLLYCKTNWTYYDQWRKKKELSNIIELYWELIAYQDAFPNVILLVQSGIDNTYHISHMWKVVFEDENNQKQLSKTLWVIHVLVIYVYYRWSEIFQLISMMLLKFLLLIIRMLELRWNSKTEHYFCYYVCSSYFYKILKLIKHCCLFVFLVSWSCAPQEKNHRKKLFCTSCVEK